MGREQRIITKVTFDRCALFNGINSYTPIHLALEMPYSRVATKLSRQNSMTFQWLFHYHITKFHDLFIDIHSRWILKGCRLAPPIHENQEFVCKIPWFFHDFLLKLKISMTFPWPYPFSVKIPWLFQKFQKISKFQKFHDFSMTVATLLNAYWIDKTCSVGISAQT